MNRQNATPTLPNPVANTAYNAANQMLTFNTRDITYDENGNMTSMTNTCGTTTYTWDARNRLVGINGFDAQCAMLSAQFKYDALGRRIEKTVNGKTTNYLYDGIDILQEIENGMVAANYIRTLNIDEPLVRIKADGTVRYYQTDALGSVIALTDETGTVKTQYSYDPFGAVTVSGEASDNPFQFAGRENDGTGLLFERNRYYSYELQRYISQDPIRLAGGDVNFYVRVGNNPVNRIDPLGLHWMIDPRTGQPIAHTHNPDGSINIIHPGDSGSWPGDPAHYDPNYYPRPLDIPPLACRLLTGQACRLCSLIPNRILNIACQTVCRVGTQLPCPEKCE